MKNCNVEISSDLMTDGRTDGRMAGRTVGRTYTLACSMVQLISVEARWGNNGYFLHRNSEQPLHLMTRPCLPSPSSSPAPSPTYDSAGTPRAAPPPAPARRCVVAALRPTSPATPRCATAAPSRRRASRRSARSSQRRVRSAAGRGSAGRRRRSTPRGASGLNERSETRSC